MHTHTYINTYIVHTHTIMHILLHTYYYAQSHTDYDMMSVHIKCFTKYHLCAYVTSLLFTQLYSCLNPDVKRDSQLCVSSCRVAL